MTHIPHSQLVERYLVSALVNAPRLLDDPAVQRFEAADLLDWLAARVFSLVRNGARGPAATAAAYERETLWHQDGDRLGHKHHPELDALLQLAQRRPPARAAVHRMVRIVTRDAARRRALWRAADEPDRFEAQLIAALLDSVAHLPPGRPEQRRRAA